MSDAFSSLLVPALACVALVGIHAYFGLLVFRRNAMFVDLALAIFAGAAAAALLLEEYAPEGAEHIGRIFTGNILSVGWDELRWAIPIFLVVGLTHRFVRIRNARWSDFIFYAAFGLVATISVALAGFLLVFAFLIVPAAIGVLHAHRFGSQLAIAWAAGTVAALAGFAVSHAGDFPAEMTLVCTYGFALAVAIVAQSLRAPQPQGAKFEIAARFTRWFGAAVLCASAVWIVVSPTADQPVLDALERMFPAVRALYMDDKALAISANVERFSARYRRNDMAKDAVVARTVRHRARAANRGWIAAVFLIFALALLVRPRRLETLRRRAL